MNYGLPLMLLLVWHGCLFPIQIKQALSYGKAVEDAQRGEWKAAQEKLIELIAHEQNPYESPSLLFDTGVAAYRLQEFEQAYHYFKEVDQSSVASASLKRQAWFNAGNAAVGLKQYDDAIAWYEKLLAQYPDDEPAEHNRAYAKKMRDQQKQQQQQQEEQAKENEKKSQDQQENQDNNDGRNNDDQHNNEQQQSSADNEQQQQQQSNNKKGSKSSSPEQNNEQEDDNSNEQQSEESGGSQSKGSQQQKRLEQKQKEQSKDCDGNKDEQQGSEQQKKGQEEKKLSEQHKNIEQAALPQHEQEDAPIKAQPKKEAMQEASVQQQMNGRPLPEKNGQMDNAALASSEPPLEPWMVKLLDLQESLDKKAQKIRMKQMAGQTKMERYGQNNW